MTVQEVEISKIVVKRDERQRREIKLDDAFVQSVCRKLINPIVVTRELVLIAGERRLEAHKAGGKTTILVRFLDDLDERERQLIELEENIRRHDLPWKEEILAWDKLIELYQQTERADTQAKLAALTGLSSVTLNRYQRIARALRANDSMIHGASGISAALNILERRDQRERDNELSQLMEVEVSEDNAREASVPAVPSDKASESIAHVPAQPAIPVRGASIQQADFIDWLTTYSGERFNFVHTDFPYGINHHKSDQGAAEAWGTYEDTPEIYFDLLSAFLAKRDVFMQLSCHGIFWFSMKFYTETMQRFAELAPEIRVNPMPLIWHKTDNKGILPDPKRGPRQIYETALFWSRNDRLVLQAVSNAYGSPTDKSDHLSQKPIPMLKHFFRMVVDDSTLALDPTCGSGSAIIALSEMGAKRAVGLELLQSNVDIAGAALRKSLALRKLSEAVT